MKNRTLTLLTILFLIIGTACTNQNQPLDDSWNIDSQEDWQANVADVSNVEISDGKVVPTANEANIQSTVRKFTKKRSLRSIVLSQSPEWLNWDSVTNVGPSNLGDAPVALQLGDRNYWLFGRYNQSKSQKNENFQGEDASLEGFDIPLKTTPFENQFDAPGGQKPGLGGYHAWQSKDMINWVHHGPVSESFSKWVTTAEYADGKLYLYYDFPNDQDPHVYIDENLTDGVPGKNMGMAYKNPSHGSDCAVIRDLEGNFHLIAEDWSPINASIHAWDSPLAVHAVSPNGIDGFKILNSPVDERTNPTGKFAEYVHPHWHVEDPENYPGRTATQDVPQHRVKAGETYAFAEYEIHEPEQNAYGDWAAISIGGQYYLFCDFDPAGGHGRESMSVAWFTSDNINKQFTFCGNIGRGHPDPDIMFAEGQFYLVTQMNTDYVSPGPWVETIQVRMGVDTTNNSVIDYWSDWQTVKESYDYIEGFAKQIERIPATLDLSELPEGYSFQFEVKIIDSTKNESKPILDKVVINFDE